MPRVCKWPTAGRSSRGARRAAAFDNAISAIAAQDKGIASAVAGDADILIAPNLEAGNMMTKQLQYLADAQAAGLVLGARVPVILTSRADSTGARIASSRWRSWSSRPGWPNGWRPE
jgi:hypothetical protein